MSPSCFLVSLLLQAPPPPAPAPIGKPDLTFRQDGSALVVSMIVTVNNSSHALWTHAVVQGKDVLLRYYVFQNRQLFTRSQKTVKVEWRLTNLKKAGHRFRVEEKFEPDTAELKALLPLLHRLSGGDKVMPPPPPPCHPGCFPAGTLVQTPQGPRAIERIRAGDRVLSVPAKGKPTPVRVASVFVGRSPLVEVQTESGKLLTTTKQPLLLSTGELKPAAGLTDKDEVVRWQGGRAHNTRVRGVRAKDTQTVYNLVLEVRGTFVAGGYLAQSKPPAEE